MRSSKAVHTSPATWARLVDPAASHPPDIRDIDGDYPRSRSYDARMKALLTPVALLALGFAFGCQSEGAGTVAAGPPANESSTKQACKVEDIDAEAAARLLAEDDEGGILDIRTPDEFARGHLKGAININYSADDYADKLNELDKAKTYLMH